MTTAPLSHSHPDPEGIRVSVYCANRGLAGGLLLGAAVDLQWAGAVDDDRACLLSELLWELENDGVAHLSERISIAYA